MNNPRRILIKGSNQRTCISVQITDHNDQSEKLNRDERIVATRVDCPGMAYLIPPFGLMWLFPVPARVGQAWSRSLTAILQFSSSSSPPFVPHLPRAAQ